QYEKVDTKLIAERLQVREKDVLEMQKRLSAKDVYLDAPIVHDSASGQTIHDTLSDKRQLPIDTRLAKLQMVSIFSDHIEEFAQGLEERDHIILRERILAEEPVTLQELGNKFRVSRERVRQLEDKILQKFREFLLEKGFLDEETLEDIVAKQSNKQSNKPTRQRKKQPTQKSSSKTCNKTP
ncbi:MAG: hypothetical protein OXC40_04195, partial [Proteobacteria bacterium]|nr:hypothetical protein [Pseudomonadota bacterium]